MATARPHVPERPDSLRLAPCTPRRDVGLMCDLDGLSLDTVLPQHVVYQRILLEYFGIETTPLDFDWTVGACGRETIHGFTERYGRAEIRPPHTLSPGESIGQKIVGRLLEIRRPQEQALIDVGTMPHLPELLDFADAANLARSSSTSRPEKDAFELLTGTGLARRFDVIVGKDSEGVSHPKPAPDIFRRSAELLGIRIADSWALEDSTPGVKAAREAGAKVLYIPDSRVANPCPTARRLATHTESSLERAIPFLQRNLGME